MHRKYPSLAGVWLPSGWVWLDDKWRLLTDKSSNAQGWSYATNWSTGWSSKAGPLAHVRRRRFVRHRARASTMSIQGENNPLARTRPRPTPTPLTVHHLTSPPPPLTLP